MYVGLILGVCGGWQGGGSPEKIILRSQIILKFFLRWPRLRFRVYEFVYIYIHNLQYNSVCNRTLSISENYFGNGRGFSSP
jgi:hypothetical protein